MTYCILLTSILFLVTCRGAGAIAYNVPISSSSCDNFSTGISEHLRSPGYPNNYYNNLDCRKVIKAGPQFYVVLKFLIFQLEGSMGCKYDLLEIRDGMYGFSPLIFKGCGSDIRSGTVFESTGQHMWIRFLSDAEISSKGFLATVSAKPREESKGAPDDSYDCYTLIENQISFELGDDSLPKEFWYYARKNPDKPVHCVWDIRMPEPSKVFVRITNYTASHLTVQCESNYLEVYDQSTASTDIRRVDCAKPHTGWISGSSRALLHLYSHSLATLPQFTVTDDMFGNCSSETMLNCFDGYCIPISLECDKQENCGEGYDEDCSLDTKSPKFQSKYIALFIVVIVGCLFLTTLMTISEVYQKRKQARKERAEKKASAIVEINMSTRSSIRTNTPSDRRDRFMNSSRDQTSMVTADSYVGTFRSSRFNENVSFRKAPTASSASRQQSEDRLYQTPHSITLPPQCVVAEIPPAPPTPTPPTPPPPPAPPQEGKGFRLIYDLTNLGKNTGTFEYPPPPSFLRADSDGDIVDSSTIADYTSTSSSSFNSLPQEHTYDVACLERKKGKPSPNAIKLTDIPSEATKLLSPAKRTKKFRSEAPKYSPPQAPGATKRSWTFDDDTDDGAMELTTYISTC